MSCPEPLESLLRRETWLSPGVHLIGLVWLARKTGKNSRSTSTEKI